MMNGLRKIALISALLLCAHHSYSQSEALSDLIFTGQGSYGIDMEKARPNQKSFGYMTYGLGVGYQADPNEECQYARAFGFPVFNFGFSLARMSNFQFSDQTSFSDFYSLFGSFERTLLRKSRFSAGYKLDFGLSYNPDRYDPINNPGNNWLSSPLMAYFGAGAFIEYHMGKHWSIGADAMFRHYSNGRLALPNEALNSMGGGLYVRYRMDEYDYSKYLKSAPVKPDYEKGFQYMLTLGTGFHACMAEWHAYVERADLSEKQAVNNLQIKAHPKYSLSFDAVYRYSLRYATGIGLDLFYSTNMKELEASDRIVYGDELVNNSPGYNPLSVGIALIQEVYWRNFAVHISVGAYPYRHKGVNGPETKEIKNESLGSAAVGDRERGWHYEKAGLRYYMPKLGDTFVGFAIKSHKIKAEYLEFSIGKRFGR